MEPLKTVIFVDGRNFKYSLQAFRFQAEGAPNTGRYYRLDEKHFHWREFFLGVVNKFAVSTGFPHRLVRAYWYNAETIRPYQVTDRLVDNVLQQFKAQHPSLTPDMIKGLAKGWYDRERSNFDYAKEAVFEGIQRRIDFLEFKYVGEYVVKPFEPHRLSQQEDGEYFYQGTREGEKGVDVGIAIDMIAKLQAYDVAVLVSGDADFLPAVRYLKDSLKQVYQFSLALDVPPQINYLSPWLIGRVDAFRAFDELEFLDTYLNRASGIPPAILKSIDVRLNYLRGVTANGPNG